MTLVIIGLLMGLVGLVWVVVIDIVFSDRKSSTRCSPKGEMPLQDPSAPESRAA
jgi:hypothetical protein